MGLAFGSSSGVSPPTMSSRHAICISSDWVAMYIALFGHLWPLFGPEEEHSKNEAPISTPSHGYPKKAFAASFGLSYRRVGGPPKTVVAMHHGL